MIVDFLEQNYDLFQEHIEEQFSIDPTEAEFIIEELREFEIVTKD